MTGGLLPLLRAAVSICIASAWNWSENRGQLKVKDIGDEGLNDEACRASGETMLITENL